MTKVAGGHETTALRDASRCMYFAAGGAWRPERSLAPAPASSRDIAERSGARHRVLGVMPLTATSRQNGNSDAHRRAYGGRPCARGRTAANRAPAPKKEHFTVCGFHLQHSIMGLRRAN